MVCYMSSQFSLVVKGLISLRAVDGLLKKYVLQSNMIG
jgi:hypothetical protein